MDTTTTTGEETGTRAERPVKARDLLRAWVRERVKDEEEVDVPQLAHESWEHFDAEFFERLGREQAAELIYSIVSSNLQPSKQARKLKTLAANEQLRDDVKSKIATSVFKNWYEEVEQGRKVSVLSMTGADLDKAIAIRRESSREHERRASFMEHLRARVKDNETVGEKWAAQEMLDAFDKIVGSKR